MPNPHKGEVNVQLGGKTYKCRLTIDAIMQIEQVTGIGIIKLATMFGEADVSVTNLIAVLHPALRGGGNDFEPKEVHKIVEEAGLIAVTKAVAELLSSTLNDESANPDGDAKKLEA